MLNSALVKGDKWIYRPNNDSLIPFLQTPIESMLVSVDRAVQPYRPLLLAEEKMKDLLLVDTGIHPQFSDIAAHVLSRGYYYPVVFRQDRIIYNPLAKYDAASGSLRFYDGQLNEIDPRERRVTNDWTNLQAMPLVNVTPSTKMEHSIAIPTMITSINSGIMQIQSHYLEKVNASMQQALEQGKNWMVYDGRPIFTNPNYLKYFVSPEEARKEAGLDFSIPTPMRAVLLEPVATAVQKTADLHRSQEIQFGHTLTIDVDKVLNNYAVNTSGQLIELKKDATSLTNNDMNQKNFDYLSKQMQWIGLGDGLLPKLKEAIEKGEKEFTIGHSQEFGKQSTAATLHFRKSDTSDMYFFNKYNFLLKKPNEDPIKQSFYINPNEKNVTFKEAYNLMNGRAVYRELATKEGEKYKAWVQLDFKNTDKYGNFEIKKFTEQYGYDLKSVLSARPIKELNNIDERNKLVDALERGNRYPVTFDQNGKEVKAFIEAAPQYKSLNYYNENHKRIDFQTITASLQPSTDNKQEKNISNKQVQKAGNEEDAPSEGRKRTRKMKM